MACISSSFIYILISRGRTKFFKPTKGIRQRCPISPYIFIMCMELLSRTIDHEVDSPTGTPSLLPQRDQEFFISSFLMISPYLPKEKNCQTIMNTLNIFSYFYGQNINTIKSKVIFSHNCSREDRDHLVGLLNIKDKDTFG